MASFATLPAIYSSYAVKYYITAPKYIAEWLPTRCPTILYFNNLFILPTGNNKPARDAFDLPAATLPIFEPFPLDAGTTVFGLDNPVLFPTSNDPVLDNAFLSLLF